jgi:hypothetical protein
VELRCSGWWCPTVQSSRPARRLRARWPEAGRAMSCGEGHVVCRDARSPCAPMRTLYPPHRVWLGLGVWVRQSCQPPRSPASHATAVRSMGVHPGVRVWRAGLDRAWAYPRGPWSNAGVRRDSVHAGSVQCLDGGHGRLTRHLPHRAPCLRRLNVRSWQGRWGLRVARLPRQSPLLWSVRTHGGGRLRSALAA